MFFFSGCMVDEWDGTKLCQKWDCWDGYVTVRAANTSAWNNVHMFTYSMLECIYTLSQVALGHHHKREGFTVCHYGTLMFITVYCLSSKHMIQHYHQLTLYSPCNCTCDHPNCFTVEWNGIHPFMQTHFPIHMVYFYDIQYTYSHTSTTQTGTRLRPGICYNG